MSRRAHAGCLQRLLVQPTMGMYAIQPVNMSPLSIISSALVMGMPADNPSVMGVADASVMHGVRVGSAARLHLGARQRVHLALQRRLRRAEPRAPLARRVGRRLGALCGRLPVMRARWHEHACVMRGAGWCGPKTGGGARAGGWPLCRSRHLSALAVCSPALSHVRDRGVRAKARGAWAWGR